MSGATLHEVGRRFMTNEVIGGNLSLLANKVMETLESEGISIAYSCTGFLHYSDMFTFFLGYGVQSSWMPACKVGVQLRLVRERMLWQVAAHAEHTVLNLASSDKAPSALATRNFHRIQVDWSLATVDEREQSVANLIANGGRSWTSKTEAACTDVLRRLLEHAQP